jgi:hypothetical protein
LEFLQVGAADDRDPICNGGDTAASQQHHQGKAQPAVFSTSSTPHHLIASVCQLSFSRISALTDAAPFTGSLRTLLAIYLQVEKPVWIVVSPIYAPAAFPPFDRRTRPSFVVLMVRFPSHSGRKERIKASHARNYGLQVIVTPENGVHSIKWVSLLPPVQFTSLTRAALLPSTGGKHRHQEHGRIARSTGASTG